MKTLLLLVSTLLFSSVAAVAQELPADYWSALTELGDKKADFKDNVFKVAIPRNDLKMSVANICVPTNFGFAGWIAMTKGTGGKEVLMGDLVLLEDEVNPVMSALLEKGFEVTALHNHFFWETPRVFYMHVHGHGEASELTKALRPALDLIGKVTPAASAPSCNSSDSIRAGKFDTEKLNALVGRKGEQNGDVYKFTIGRDDLAVKEMGATINSRMGLNTWASFFGEEKQAVIAGDVAMLEDEVTPVLKALRQNGLDVVAIHHHMTGTEPMIIFLHFWGKGPAESLAQGFRAALNQIGHGLKHSG